MRKEQIAKLNTFVAENAQMQKIHVSVYLVYRGNFNDERLIESAEFSVAELLDKPLVWLDAYLGKKIGNEKKFAFVYLKNRDLYFLENDGENTKLVKKTGFTHYYSDDYDERYIISTHIW